MLRFSNFAHGDLMALGTMGVILVTWWLQGLGVSLGPLPTALLALPVGILAAAILALLTDRWVYRFYRKRAALGDLRDRQRRGHVHLQRAHPLRDRHRRAALRGRRPLRDPRPRLQGDDRPERGLAIRTSQVITVVGCWSPLRCFWFLQKTRTGKAMRAYSDNEDLALLSGINPDRVVMITWILAAALATIAGTLYGLDKSFRPFTYFQLLLPIFAAAMVGGVGQPLGAIAAGSSSPSPRCRSPTPTRASSPTSCPRPGSPRASCRCSAPTTSSPSPSSSLSSCSWCGRPASFEGGA